MFTTAGAGPGPRQEAAALRLGLPCEWQGPKHVAALQLLFPSL